jgi:O-antigen/teichoic acid export membrane protein
MFYRLYGKTMSQVEMANKLKSGFVLLAGRSVVTKILQIVSSLILAYKILPEDYGSFGIIYGFLGSLIFLTDVGLGDLLIQKNEEITKEEISSYLGIRLSLGFFWALFFAGIFPFILSYYKITIHYSSLIPIVAIILPFEAFIGASVVLVQKKLHFKSFAKIELLESITLYVVQIFLAFMGFGVWSFFLGILTSRLLKLIYCIDILKGNSTPSFNLKPFKGKYKSGMYFQLNSIIPTSKAMILPIVLALYLDIHTIGIIFWITSLVSIPLVLAYNYNSILFPALSKYQDDSLSAKELASHSLEKMILVVVFIFGIGGLLGDNIIGIVFNKNWSDAKDLIFYCSLFHFFYSVRFMTYPLLYAKKLEKERMWGEFSLVIVEYVCVFMFCSYFKAKGYFISLALINLLSFYYFSFQVKDWLRSHTFKRFHLSIIFLGIVWLFDQKKFMNLTDFEILIWETLIYILFFSAFYLILDQEVKKNIKKKFRKNNE